MVITLKAGIEEPEIARIRERVEALGLRTFLTRGESRIIIACVGVVESDHQALAGGLPGVESVVRISKPWRLAGRAAAAEATVVRVGDGPGGTIGGLDLAIIAGPCSVEGAAMLRETARAVQAAGAGMLRGGAFKPRTSPWGFTGMGREGLELLAEVRRETGMPIVTEVMDTRQVDLVAGYADVLQVGARNMQNFALLQELGRVQRPVLLKRGLSATITEFLLAAEHILAHGNRDVILCERGIRTFETYTRNTLDVAAVAVLKAETHLPVIVDPSHAGGKASLVAPLSFAAIAAGADGLIVEVHPCPAEALTDGEQSLAPDGFAALMAQLAPFVAAAGRTLAPVSAARVAA